MKLTLLITLLITCVIQNGYSQESIGHQDTIKFELIPDIVKSDINKKLAKSLDLEKIKGILEVQHGKNTHRYSYDLTIKNNQFFGTYSYFYDCATCDSENYFYNVKSIAMYCCKDIRHTPQEMAKTKNEILKIKKKFKCSKVGICII